MKSREVRASTNDGSFPASVWRRVQHQIGTNTPWRTCSSATHRLEDFSIWFINSVGMGFCSIGSSVTTHRLGRLSANMPDTAIEMHLQQAFARVGKFSAVSFVLILIVSV
jgi:hypothetical protein